ncbi:hypothetical protein P3T76_009437 [Phytophthora citrophthora]|uniref:Uncharacterized protein n=1 Tax=Phytophthora citrophthora TaxID=4793 RepID=A0AAD9LJU5_9STRA|nr:hypothetical protein P3T76_009437 [Phytophthora citrophthora]
MIDCGSRRGLGCVATDLAAVMSVAHIFFWRGGNDKKAKAEAATKKAQFLISDGDIVSKELRGIFRKTAGWKIGGNDAKADDAVDGESIRRLITAGYFMNVARLKPVSRFGLQYYALFSGVTGSLHFGSALNPDRNV